MEVNKTKTRNLTIYEFFETLQLEYIVLELRKKIYPALVDKEYYQRVMNQKKEKIDDIADKNNLPSIFSDKKIKQHKYHEVYGNGGFPNFFYKDEEHQAKYAPQDRKNYYLLNSEVKIIIEGEIKVGKIGVVDLTNDKAKVICDDQVYELTLENITRVL